MALTEAQIASIKNECRWTGMTAKEIRKIDEEWNAVIDVINQKINRELLTIYRDNVDFRMYVYKDMNAYHRRASESLKQAHVREYAVYLLNKQKEV